MHNKCDSISSHKIVPQATGVVNLLVALLITITELFRVISIRWKVKKTMDLASVIRLNLNRIKQLFLWFYKLCKIYYL